MQPNTMESMIPFRLVVSPGGCKPARECMHVNARTCVRVCACVFDVDEIKRNQKQTFS